MTYQIEFSAEPEIDADFILEYYDSKVPGLRLRFLDDLHNSILSLESNSFAFHAYIHIPKIRRCNLDIFPYAIYFTIESDNVKILAIIHERRSKTYIKRKLK
jgi:hypothetical protein